MNVLKLPLLKHKTLTQNFISNRSLFNFIHRSFSTEVTPKTEEVNISKTPEEYLKNLTKEISNLPPQELTNAVKTGAELYLTPGKLNSIQRVGFNFRDINPVFDFNTLNNKGSMILHQYLKNMLLLNDYNNIFRSFLQAIAQDRRDGLELVTEPRLLEYVFSNLRQLRQQGYNIELSDLKILQEYSVLRFELFKNIHINRYINKSFDKYSFREIPTPIGKCTVATELGVDNGYFTNNKPYILATTMHIRSPMKIQVYNQNLSKKLHGGEKGEVLDYVVRFESEMNLNDFSWILPTQNKPKRLRQTKITDFNNVLRGNPYFVEKIDLSGEKEERYRYMQKGEDKDREVSEKILTLNKAAKLH